MPIKIVRIVVATAVEGNKNKNGCSEKRSI